MTFAFKKNFLFKRLIVRKKSSIRSTVDFWLPGVASLIVGSLFHILGTDEVIDWLMISVIKDLPRKRIKNAFISFLQKYPRGIYLCFFFLLHSRRTYIHT